MSRELLSIEYIPLCQAVLWDTNPKKHDIPKIIASIQKHGYKDPAKFEPELNGGKGGLVEGNGRTVALKTMQERGYPLPAGLDITADGEWCVPVLFGVDAKSEAAAEAYAIDHNNLTLGGSGMSVLDEARLWDESYQGLLKNLADEGELPISVTEDDVDALAGLVPTRPDFSGLIEKFDLSRPGKAAGNEKWFYVEYYEDPMRWEKLLSLLAPYLTPASKHDLNSDFFFDMVIAHFEGGQRGDS